jgi:hypothetical protein
VASSSQPSLTAAAMGVAGPAAVQNAVMAIQQSMALPQLRWLTAGVMCKLSLCCFAPNLTRLKDVSTHADSAAVHAMLPKHQLATATYAHVCAHRSTEHSTCNRKPSFKPCR